MSVDPVVAEVRAIREEYAKKFNYDVRALCRDLQEQEEKTGRTTVSLTPKRLKDIPQSASPLR